MSGITDPEEYIKEVGFFKPCPAMNVLLTKKYIGVNMVNENDNGFRWIVSLGGIMIKYCPSCGQKLTEDAMPDGICINPDLKPHELPHWIVNGVCEKPEKAICNLGYACDGCPYNEDIEEMEKCG